MNGQQPTSPHPLFSFLGGAPSGGLGLNELTGPMTGVPGLVPNTRAAPGMSMPGSDQPFDIQGIGELGAEVPDQEWWKNPRLIQALAGGLGYYTGAKSARAYNKPLREQADRVNASYAKDRARFAEGGYVQDIPEGYEIDPSVGGWLQQIFNRATGGNPEHFPMRRREVSPPPVIIRDEPSQMDLARSNIQERKRSLNYACGGLAHYVKGGTAGQADKIPALLSDGEYVIDAETVAMLGDGNNAAGASALEQMRQNVRKQKRAAPAHKIPPKAKAPEAYLKKGGVK